jgi:hypothetical protein
MKKFAWTVVVVSLAIPFALAGQNPPAAPQVPAPGAAPAAPAPGTNALVDYTRQIKYDGLTISVVLVNARTADVLFQAPMKYSMRARAAQQTVLYVQGTTQKDIDFSSEFSIVQGADTLNGTSTSIKNFATGKIATGQRIDGIVEFAKKVDISKPFTVKNGKGEVQFVLSPEAIKALEPVAPGN